MLIHLDVYRMCLNARANEDMFAESPPEDVNEGARASKQVRMRCVCGRRWRQDQARLVGEPPRLG